MHLIDRTAVGHMLAVNATGKIALYQAFLGGSLILTLPIAWLFVHLNWGVYATGWAMVTTMMCCAWGRVWFARTIAGMSAWHWIRKILLPLAVVFGLSLMAGALPRFLLKPGLARVVLTTILCEVVLVSLSWKFLLNEHEKAVLLQKLRPWKSVIRNMV